MNTLKAERRDLKTKAKKLRREGYVTGNVFGRDIKGSIPLQYNMLEADAFLKENWEGSKAVLELDGKQMPVVVKEVQYSFILTQYMELDFQTIPEEKKPAAGKAAAKKPAQKKAEKEAKEEPAEKEKAEEPAKKAAAKKPAEKKPVKETAEEPEEKKAAAKKPAKETAEEPKEKKPAAKKAAAKKTEEAAGKPEEKEESPKE